MHRSHAADGDSKRDYVRWAPQEEETFYLALRGVAGQKPEICLREITNRLTGSKDYAQVGGLSGVVALSLAASVHGSNMWHGIESFSAARA